MCVLMCVLCVAMHICCVSTYACMCVGMYACMYVGICKYIYIYIECLRPPSEQQGAIFSGPVCNPALHLESQSQRTAGLEIM